jgi:hypothetical protein
MAWLIHAPKSTEAMGTRATRLRGSQRRVHQGRRAHCHHRHERRPNPKIAEEPIVWNGCATLATAAHTQQVTSPHLIKDAGAVMESDSVQDKPLDLEDWMARTETPAATPTRSVSASMTRCKEAPRTGLRPARGAEGPPRGR